MSQESVIDLELSPSLSYLLEDDTGMDVEKFDLDSIRDRQPSPPPLPSTRMIPTTSGNNGSKNQNRKNNTTTTATASNNNGNGNTSRNNINTRDASGTNNTITNNQGLNSNSAFNSPTNIGGNNLNNCENGASYVGNSIGNQGLENNRDEQPLRRQGSTTGQRGRFRQGGGNDFGFGAGGGYGRGRRNQLGYGSGVKGFASVPFSHRSDLRSEIENIRQPGMPMHQFPFFGAAGTRGFGHGGVGGVGGSSVGAGAGGFPWMDPMQIQGIPFDVVSLCMAVQQSNEENQLLRTRLADQEQDLIRTRLQLEHFRRKFKGLREEADQALRDWSRDPALMLSSSSSLSRRKNDLIN
ncbi:hypothetical protein BGZ83_001551 [Gryganskiella cystojenkinii]|nr:hypothetical protein BGZ83_001551 [Gryganskiella cystojenkinii]